MLFNNAAKVDGPIFCMLKMEKPEGNQKKQKKGFHSITSYNVIWLLIFVFWQITLYQFS
jgi:hypothetical protein